MSCSPNLTLAAIVLIVLIVIVVVCGHLFGARMVEHYGEPPGMIRSLAFRELGDRGWADMPRDFEGNTASAPSAYIMWSAGDGQNNEELSRHAFPPLDPGRIGEMPWAGAGWPREGARSQPSRWGVC